MGYFDRFGQFHGDKPNHARIRCDECHLVFAAGHVPRPVNGRRVCTECRAKLAQLEPAPPPTLFA